MSSFPGPGLRAARGHGRLRGDVVAGVTVAAYLVPQVMAYAEVAGLPAVSGLWAAAAAMLVYAFIGSSTRLSVGPESTTALMTASSLAALGVSDPDQKTRYAAVLALLVGVLCVVAWAARLGFVAELLPKTVLVGYLAGIAVLMVQSQLGRLTGLEVPGGSVLEESRYVVTHLGEAHLPTVAVATGVLGLLVVLALRAPRIPGPLVVMLLATAAVAGLGLADDGVVLVGELSPGVSGPALPRPDPALVRELLPAALGIMVVGFADNVLTARAFASRHGERVDNQRELLALGAANVASGLVRAFPVSSSGSRTALADAAGGRSQAHSLVAVATVALAVWLAAPVLAAFPAAALGGVVVYAASRLVDVEQLRTMARLRRTELWLALATTASVVVLGPLVGVLVAVGLSALDLLHRVARPHDGVLAFVPGVAGMHDVDDYPTARQVPGLLVYRYDSPLFFANAQDFLRRALAAVDAAATPVRWFLLNAEAVVTVDTTALDALESLADELDRRGIALALARVKHELHEDLVRGRFVTRVGEDRIFPTLPTAVTAYLAAHPDAARHPTDRPETA